MTVLEKKSLRKKKAILSLVDKGEYSPAYALMLVEDLSDNGKLTDEDYEELADYLESLLDEPEPQPEPEPVEEILEDNSGNEEIQEETEENSEEENTEVE